MVAFRKPRVGYEDRGGAQCLGRALELMRIILRANAAGATLLEVVEASEFSKTTAHRILQELTHHGLLMRDPGKRYRLGRLAYEFGVVASGSFSLNDVCQDAIDNIAALTKDTIFVSIRSGANAFCVQKKDASGQGDLTIYPTKGHTQPLGVGAGGLAILSFLPESLRRDVMQCNRRELARYRGLSSEILESMVEETRRRGFSQSNFVVPGVTSIGIPIVDRIGRPMLALSVATCTNRMSVAHQREILSSLTREGDALREKLLVNCPSASLLAAG